MRFNERMYENTLIASFKYLQSKNMIINAKIRSSVRCLAADLEKVWKHKSERTLRNQREVKVSVEIFGFYIKKEEKPEEGENDEKDEEDIQPQQDEHEQERTLKESENKESQVETITDEYTVERIIVKSYATPKDKFQPLKTTL